MVWSSRSAGESRNVPPRTPSRFVGGGVEHTVEFEHIDAVLELEGSGEDRKPLADLRLGLPGRLGNLAGGRVLRSRTPGLARQEAWALLITYQAIRAIICHAAAGTDPGRLSFTTALHAARRTLASPTATLASAGSEILANPLPGRPPRNCARALADPTRPYPARNGKPQPLPQAARYTLTITPSDTTTRQHRDQQQHATSRAATPP